jgi:PAS domain S-box-containing protein
MDIIRIALVEDNASDSELTTRILNKGFNKVYIQTYYSVKNFISDCTIKDFDIIIAEHQLQDGNSFDIIEFVKKENVNKPIIILSGELDDKIIAKLIRKHKVNDIIFKSDLHRLNQAVLKEVETFKTFAQLEQQKLDLKILSLVASHTHNGVIITNAEEKIVWVNDAYTNISGYTFQESLNKVPGSFLQGNETDRLTKKRIRQHLNKKVPFSEEILNYSKTGKQYWIKLDITPIFEDGVHTGFVAIQEDVTERKKTDLRLEENEKLFRSLTDNLSGAVLRYSMGDTFPGTIDFISEQCFDLFGLTQKEILEDNNKLMALIHPDDIEALGLSVEESAKNLTLWSFQYRLETPTGQKKWFRANGLPRKDKESSKIIWTTLVVDVTKEVKAENDLRSSEELFRSLTDNLSGVVIRYSMGEGNPGTIEYISERCSDIYEITQQEILEDNMKLWGLIDPEDAERMGPTIVESAEHLSHWSFLYRMTTQSGKKKWIRASGSPRPLKENNQVVWDIIAIDVTKEVEFETQLMRSNSRLKEAQKAGKIGDWQFDLKTQKTTWSEETYKIYDRDKSLDVPDYEQLIFGYTINGHEFHEYIQKAITEGLPYEIPIQIKSEAGILKDVMAVGLPIKDENGQVIALFGTAQDITDRMDAVRKSKDSEDRLDAAIRGADLSVWDLDVIAGINTVNTRWFTMMGLEPGEIQTDSETFMSRVHPEDRPLIESEFIRLANGEDDNSINLRLLHKNGSYIHVKDQGRVVDRDETGAPIRIIGTNIDITREVEYQNAILDANHRLNNAQKAGKIGDWHFDLVNQSITWSEETYNIYDRDKDKGVPSYEELIFQYTVDKSEEFHNLIQRAITEGIPYELNIQLKTDTGKIKDVVAIGIPAKNEKDEVVALFGTAQDITRRMEAVRKIQDSEDSLELAISGANLAVWDLDIESGVNLVNTRWYSMLGHEPYEFEASFQSFLSLLHPNDKILILDATEKLNNGENEFAVIVRLRHKDGSFRVIRDQGRVVERYENGEIKRLIGTNHDITNEIKLRDELTQSVHDKTILLQEIHHRVKNNLAVIIGLLYLQSYTTEQKELSQFYSEMSNRIKSIADVHELLYSSETLSKINLKTYIDKLFNNVLSVSKTNSPLNPIIFIDEDLELNINQAIPLGLLVNELLTNSVKHAFEGVENPTISFTVLKEEDMVSIVYKDNGIGFEIEGHSSPTSLGFTLINTLLGQLESEYTFTNSIGFGIEFSFPLVEKGSHSYLSN